MKKLSSTTIISALKSMVAEINAVRKEAADFKNELDEMAPEEISVGMGDEGAGVGAPEDSFSPVPEEEGKPGEEAKGPKKPEIKSVDDAKKVLNEAKTDLQNVIDSLDGLTGQATDEAKEASYKRMNEKYAQDLNGLRNSAESALKDAKEAIAHWSFLRNLHNPISSIKHPQLKQAAETIKEVNAFQKFVNKLIGKTATAVAPTGAEFSGDKWPGGKDPKDIEDRQWRAGTEKFNRDKSFEGKRTNPAVDHRLDVEEYSRDDKPYVNATFVTVPNNKFASYWNVADTKTGKCITASFADIPNSLLQGFKDGSKGEEAFNRFATRQYGGRIVDHVLRFGIDSATKMLNGKQANIREASLQSQARDPKIKDKSAVRKYYKDAFGDSEYARQLTSSEGGSNDGMDVEYTPKDKGPDSKNTSDDTGKAKDGTGKLSHQKQVDPTIIKARAEKAVDLARKFASTGAIEFTKQAVFAKAKEIMRFTDDQFRVADQTISSLPIVNRAALVESHIPDTENGIVGNKSEGVSNPKATVATEDIDSGVKSDAKIQSMASQIVPQMTTDIEGRKASIGDSFNTTANKLKRLNVDPSKLRLPRRLSR